MAELSAGEEMGVERPSWPDPTARARAVVPPAASDAPFTPGDITAGVENEYCTAVAGAPSAVDLPRELLWRGVRNAQGDAVARAIEDNRAAVWEHSYVRFPRSALHPAAAKLLQSDIGTRDDQARYLISEGGASWLRVPPSYVLKLALADITGNESEQRQGFVARAAQVMRGLLNDNTAPELTSVFIAGGTAPGGIGRAVADETAMRFLLAQALVEYANTHFGLRAHGQTLRLYSAPNPPRLLRRFAAVVPVEQYRELLLNPCLSGFTDGERKFAYMRLCHATLSRSRAKAVERLIATGIAPAANPLAFNCDTGLLNNGVHVSVGSHALAAAASRIDGTIAEKNHADLAAKIVEHFIPLFVGLYSASPWRLSAAEMAPEHALGYLPHMLETTVLRRLWRGWRAHAGILSRVRGDLVPDYRLVDYFAQFASTTGAPALNGVPGNDERLKRELAARGIFDVDMTAYALIRPRALAGIGYSGLEFRWHSLFPSHARDMAPAVTLQALIAAFAMQEIGRGQVTHADIPDDPETESERRQFLFAAAVGAPVLYVRRDTRNAFLRRVLSRAPGVRPSNRRPGFLKVSLAAWRQGLAYMLARAGAAAVEMYRARDLLADLNERLRDPEAAASARLCRAASGGARAARALDMRADEFNAALERHYRDDLRRAHLREGAAAARAYIAPDDSSRFGEYCAALEHDRATPEALRELVVMILLALAGAEAAGGQRVAPAVCMGQMA